MKKLILLTLVALAYLNTVSLAAATAWKDKGERLHYDVRFWGLKAGDAELFFDPNLEEDTYRIVGRAWSDMAFVTILDRLTIEGTSLKTGEFLTDTYTVRLNENDYRANKKVVYDRASKEAIYQNIHAGHGEIEFPLMEGSRDMVSALYHLRHKVKEIKQGDVHTLPVFDLNTQFVLRLHVGKREKVNGRYGYEIIPVLEGVKERNEKDRWRIWISDDEERVPFKIKVKLNFGSFEANLKAVGDKNLPSRAPENLPLTGDFEPKKKKKHAHANPLED